MTGRVATLLVALLLAFAIAGCGDGDHEQKEAVDDALHDVERALGRYMTVDPEGPSAQIKGVTEQVVDAWDSLRVAAEGLDDLDLAPADEALADLVRATDEVPDDATAREAYSLIEDEVDAFADEVDEIHDVLDVH